MGKITAYGEDTLPTLDDYTVTVDESGPITKKVKWSSIGTMLFNVIGPILYPVGSIYVETTGANPNTTFGFGTWVAYAQGQALVGVAPSGTFQNAGVAVGNETHTISVGEMPTHNHGINDPGHTHGHEWNAGGGATQPFLSINGGTARLTSSGSGQQLAGGDINIDYSGTGISTQNNGSSSPMSLVQASMPVYVWQRTV